MVVQGVTNIARTVYDPVKGVWLSAGGLVDNTAEKLCKFMGFGGAVPGEEGLCANGFTVK